MPAALLFLRTTKMNYHHSKSCWIIILCVLLTLFIASFTHQFFSVRAIPDRAEVEAALAKGRELQAAMDATAKANAEADAASTRPTTRPASP